MVQAKQKVASLGLLTKKEYWIWKRHSPDAAATAIMPMNPDVHYEQSGWQGWDDFILGERAGHKYKAFRSRPISTIRLNM